LAPSLIKEEIKDILKEVLREYEIEKGSVEEDLSTDTTLLQGFI
jgi:acyl carrier protein